MLQCKWTNIPTGRPSSWKSYSKYRCFLIIISFLITAWVVPVQSPKNHKYQCTNQSLQQLQCKILFLFYFLPWFLEYFELWFKMFECYIYCFRPLFYPLKAITLTVIFFSFSPGWPDAGHAYTKCMYFYSLFLLIIFITFALSHLMLQSNRSVLCCMLTEGFCVLCCILRDELNRTCTQTKRRVWVLYGFQLASQLNLFLDSYPFENAWSSLRVEAACFNGDKKWLVVTKWNTVTKKTFPFSMCAQT